jgi:hypothetical protein
MPYQSVARRRDARWLVVLAFLLITGMLATTSALAAPSFTFQQDTDGANDEPGQKDLTAQASAVDQTSPFHFFTAWKWDDLSWSGNNTGDGCSLFDNDNPVNFFVDYAVCATVAGGQGAAVVTLSTVTFYSCNDKWQDRCGNPVLLLTASASTTPAASTYCTVTDSAPGQFDTADTQIVCDITALEAAAGLTAGTLGGGSLLNTCSYPSREPNSDPSDCVVTPTAVNTSVATQASGTWSVTLNDTATMTPDTATGSVVFKLWGVNNAGTCQTLIWQSNSVTLTNGVASSVNAGTASGSRTITNLTVDTDGIYYWTVDYTPGTGDLFNASSSLCGATNETVTITNPLAFS